MYKLILVNGDIATGKTHLADLIKNRFNLPLYTKDEFKEKFSESHPYSTYEESHKLSIMAMDALVNAFSKFAKSKEDIILEANFHEDYLEKINDIANENGYHMLNINLIGSPEVLYHRYMNRMNHEDRHPVHRVNKINDYEEFERYTLTRKNEKMYGEVIDVNADDFAYQNDAELLKKIEKFLNA